MNTLVLLYLVLATSGLVVTLLTFIQTWEHRRYHRSRWRHTTLRSEYPQVTLIVPCKGIDLELERNLRAFFCQESAAFEICFVVETDSDSALQVIEPLQREFAHVSSRVVVAGLATDCGQKVYNLIAATRSVDTRTQILAFADSDARPTRLWLARMVRRLSSGKVGIVTGFRWLVPLRPSWTNLILCGLNNHYAGLARLSSFDVVWGGSWAARVETFHNLGLPEAWQGCLNDDLRLSRLARTARVKVAYEPHCLVASPVDMRLSEAAEFVRRQFLQLRIYLLTIWLAAVATAAFTALNYWGSAILFVAWIISPGPWWLAAAFGLTYFLLNSIQSSVRLNSIRPFLDIGDKEFQRSARVELFAAPAIAACSLLGLLASTFGRTIVWRGVRYRIVSRTNIVVESRTALTDGRGSRHADTVSVSTAEDASGQDAAKGDTCPSWEQTSASEAVPSS